MDNNLRILVVDDSEVIRETMENLIRDAGYAVESAGGAHEALLLHAKKQYDLFLIDVVMPDVNGLSMLKELRIYDTTCEAVMMTGHESLDDAGKAMELGAFGYLVKPVKRNDLVGMVQKALAMVVVKKKRFDRLQSLENAIRSRTRELENAVGILETQAQRLDTVINSMCDGLLAIDRENAVVLLNGKAEKILGVRFGDCAGQRLDRIPGRCSSPELLDVLTDAARKEKAGDRSISYDVSGEGIRHYSVNVRDVLDKDGNMSGRLALFNDQTDKISADHLRNSFLTILAHELRTPLTVIMNYLPLLASEKSAGLQQKEAVGDMRTASLRMKKLIDTIMSIALFSSPSVSPRDFEVDICSIVEQEIADVAAAHDGNAPHIRIENILGCPMVRTDPTLVRIIISGLLGNAVKFNKEGGIVTIRIEPAIIEGRQAVAMTFRDQGKGLTEFSKKHLYEVFSQGEEHLTRKTNGLGSGLFLANRAAKLLGGKLVMHDNHDCGMSSLVTLPVRVESPAKQTTHR